MKQICENNKKPNFGPNVGLFGPTIFFGGFYLYQYLNIVPSYHLMQFKGKLMNQTSEKAEYLVLGPILVRFYPKFGPPNFFCGFYFYQMLDIVASFHCIQFQGKLMNQTSENDKKPSFRPNFGPFGPNLGPQNFCSRILFLLDDRHCCKLSLYSISRKTNEPNLSKCQKTQFRARFWPLWPLKKFFFVDLTSTRCWKLLQAITVCSAKEN